MKNFKRVVSVIMIISLIIGISWNNVFVKNVNANDIEMENVEVNKDDVMEESVFQPYDEQGELTEEARVCLEFTDYNVDGFMYVVDTELKKNVSSSVYNDYVYQVQCSNQILQKVKQENLDVTIVTPEDELKEKNYVTRYKGGKTDIEIKVWGIKVYISKSALVKGVQTGCLVGGIYIPKPAVLIILGVLSIYADDLIPGGIKFDLKYVDVGVAILTELLSGSINMPMSVAKAVSNVKWQ